MKKKMEGIYYGLESATIVLVLVLGLLWHLESSKRCNRGLKKKSDLI